MEKKNTKPNRPDFKTPVGWLMGRELLAGLKWITAYTFMGDKLDPKDWMVTEPITPPRNNNFPNDPYWFDYIADTGDGMNAVYNIAYLCMSDLWVDKNNSLGEEAVGLSSDKILSQRLPRGEFLFIGGDTAYHIADAASLKERFQTPFNCAALDIKNISGKLPEKRPIYGIPANHDYYDALHGFNRQFSKPINDEKRDPLQTDAENSQLGLIGFQREQTASYVALKLPFSWWLWGLDCQDGKIDKRQIAFFVSTYDKNLVRRGGLFDKKNQEQTQKLLQDKSPEKLIVTTPEPGTIFGKWATTKKLDTLLKLGPENPKEQIVATFASLGLEPSFISDKNGTLSKEKCRLDLSGDIHHYERYWGNQPSSRNQSNYASVVAGGGGAFLHPSHTNVGDIQQQALYPSRKDSHALITKAILNPINIWKGGFIWLAGGFLALLSYYAVTIPQSTWSLFKLLPDNLRPAIGVHNDNILSHLRTMLDPKPTMATYGCCSWTYFLDLLYIIGMVGAGGYLVYWLLQEKKKMDTLEDLTAKRAWLASTQERLLRSVGISAVPLLLFISMTRQELPHPFLAGALIDLFVISAVLLFSLSRIYSDILIDYARTDKEPPFAFLPLWVFNGLAITYMVFGFLRYGAYSSTIMTFDLLMAIVWSLSTIGLVALAAVSGAQLLTNSGKIRFAAIGVWHSLLQVAVPVALVLYCDWTTIFMITGIAVALTLLAGYVFTQDFLYQEKIGFSMEDQEKVGKFLFVTWVVFGLGIFLSAGWGEPVAVGYGRLLAAFLLGSLFSCIWFGWYVAVALAFNGHNNEAGGGARSECYRHMIRFKVTASSLTGYVIGIDQPVTDFSQTDFNQGQLPKFRLVDVFTIQAGNKR